ncbi:MAG: hypothetical protein GF383_09920 [Candidatus Lokiarchaeota archaeon]|nr:hypothetical protein [Candidatus Lokiarchaeota archaeon]
MKIRKKLFELVRFLFGGLASSESSIPVGFEGSDLGGNYTSLEDGGEGAKRDGSEVIR